MARWRAAQARLRGWKPHLIRQASPSGTVDDIDLADIILTG
jgi:hypothetical protein